MTPRTHIKRLDVEAHIGSPSAPTERWEAETVALPASLEYETQPQKQGRPSLCKVGGASRYRPAVLCLPRVCCAGCSTVTTNSNNSSSSNNLSSLVLGAHPLVQEEQLVGPRVLGEELEMGKAGVEVGGHPPGT